MKKNITTSFEAKLTLNDFSNSAKSLVELLKKINDSRVKKGNVKHTIPNILLQTLLSLLNGNKSLRENEEFGINNFGTSPSKSTINRILSTLDCKELQMVLNEWSLNLFSKINKENINSILAIAIDGKRLKNFVTPASDHNAILHINAFVTDLKLTINSIVTETVKVDKIRYPADRNLCHEINKTRNLSEGEAFRVIVESLTTQISSFLVTGDSAHLSTTTLLLLKENNIDFIFGLKRNTPKLFELLTNDSVVLNSFEQNEKQVHKKFEIFKIPDIIDTKATNKKNLIWNDLNLNTLIKVTTTDSKKRKVSLEKRIKTGTNPSKKFKKDRYCKNENTKIYVRYYVTSLLFNTAPEQLSKLIRDHWQVENNNHRCRDVEFKEDKSYMKNSNHVKTNGLLLNTALNLLYTKTGTNTTKKAKTSIKKELKKLTNRLDLCLEVLKD